jgi:hypothetical protein
LINNRELQERLGKLKQGAQEFFRVDIGEGIQLDGWMLKPPDFDARKRYPVLFHVYGEPWGQTVLDGWGGGQMMWHRMLAQQGYIVDERGQSWHARAAEPSVAQIHLPPDGHPQFAWIKPMPRARLPNGRS